MITVAGIQRVFPVAVRVAKRLRYRAWKALCWPVYRKFGLILEDQDMRHPRRAWEHGGLLATVSPGEWVTDIRGTTHRKPSQIRHNRNDAWRTLELHVDSGVALCWFPNRPAKFLRRLKGSERVIVAGKLRANPALLVEYEVLDCKFVAAWRPLGEDLWLRVAGWRSGRLTTNDYPDYN